LEVFLTVKSALSPRQQRTRTPANFTIGSPTLRAVKTRLDPKPLLETKFSPGGDATSFKNQKGGGWRLLNQSCQEIEKVPDFGENRRIEKKVDYEGKRGGTPASVVQGEKRIIHFSRVLLASFGAALGKTSSIKKKISAGEGAAGSP